MKKAFQVLGLFVLISCSFIYTEKAVTVVKEYDDIMIKIREKEKQIVDNRMDATISGNTIIPGISYSKIAVNDSYKKMKEYGKYNDNLLVYEKILPNVSLEKNKDKFIISGNPKKNITSLIFIIDNDKLVNQVFEILEKNNISGNFFIKDNNEKLIKNIWNKKHILGIYNGYNDWINTSSKVVGNNELKYCFTESSEVLEECTKFNKYTIKTEIITNNYLIETKKILQNGAIITYKINNSLIEELPLIIKYINSKGIEIENLDILLEE